MSTLSYVDEPGIVWPDALAVTIEMAKTHEELSRGLRDLEYMSLWDNRSTELLAANAERRATERGWRDLAMYARLVGASGDLSASDLVRVAAISREVNAWGIENAHEYLIGRSHSVLCKVFRNIGDNAESLAHAVEAMRHTTDGAAQWVRVIHISWLAVALASNQLHDESRERFQASIELAADAGDDALRFLVLNNFAYSMYAIGDREAAIAAAEKMRELREVSDVPMFLEAWDTLARIEMLDGNYAAASALLRPAMIDAVETMTTEADSVPMCRLTLAECERFQGDLEAAQASLDACVAVATERGLPQVVMEVMEEQARLFAAQGMYREAYEELQRCHVEMVALQDSEQEVRAHVVLAVHVNEETRRARDQFEDLSLSDSLTGLRNRRFVDEALPAALAAAAHAHEPISVAILDIDHFKQVNDILSHETGDEVLIALAQLLRDNTDEHTKIARLGGEEFLLIMPRTDASAAVAECERVRMAVGGHTWDSVTGDLPVTVSVGIATVAGDEVVASSAVLSSADRHLYLAKRAGRNQSSSSLATS